MTCREALDVLADYFDGSLPLMQRVSMGFHLYLCKPCRDYLDAYHKTVTASRAAFSETHQHRSEALPEDLIQAILATRPHGPRVD